MDIVLAEITMENAKIYANLWHLVEILIRNYLIHVFFFVPGYRDIPPRIPVGFGLSRWFIPVPLWGTGIPGYPGAGISRHRDIPVPLWGALDTGIPGYPGAPLGGRLH